jgi:hypothetical protein
MADLIVPFFAAGTPATITIDGVVYYVPRVDTDGHVQVDVLSTTYPTFPTTPVSGQETVASAGTAEQLPAQACKSVSIKALAGNTGKIYVAGDYVDSSTGYELAAGESVDLCIDNVNRLYIDASVNGEGVSWLAVN